MESLPEDRIRNIELLAPAANIEIGKEAILHGADAVYIGASSHGARKQASNSVEDISELTRFAHQFGARVYVTVNTIIYNNELKAVEQLIKDLYRVGVDALIVQDMSIFSMDIPPIALHASTQCDTRTAEKALFLQNIGCSQIVLARELGLDEIREICKSVNVPVECFVHGALCVSYSGRCSASQTLCGRSANRGECAQLCRLPYTLTDRNGKELCANRHLLSLRDLNLSDRIEEMLQAGVSSFKIEGRLKETGYVKNVTAAYRRIIDKIIAAHPEKYRRSSHGESLIRFEPQLNKSFNRGFTHYFVDERKPKSISSLLTPKSMGEPIEDIGVLNNGDGVSFFNTSGEYVGANINRVERNKLIFSRPVVLPKGVQLYRTSDVKWQKMIEKETARRVIDVDITINEQCVVAEDERGVRCMVGLNVRRDIARNPLHPEKVFQQLGNTIYRLRNFKNELDKDTFIPNSDLTRVRNELVELLNITGEATYKFDRRRKEIKDTKYPSKQLYYQDNVANDVAAAFYRKHGVEKIERSLETNSADKKDREIVVMTTRHCILRELGMCKKETHRKIEEPLYIVNGDNRLRLNFNCRNCEMEVLTSSKVRHFPKSRKR